MREQFVLPWVRLQAEIIGMENWGAFKDWVNEKAWEDAVQRYQCN